MSYGAEVLNSNGDVVFNTQDPVYEILGKGTVTLNLQFTNRSSDTIWNSPNFNSYSTIKNWGYSGQDVLGDWDDGVLTIYEVLNGDRIYRRTATASGQTRNYETLVAHYPTRTSNDKLYVRYVQVKAASNFSPSSGYGMEFYDATGQTTWSSSKQIITNILPLSQTTTTNRWYCWGGDLAYSQGAACGMPLYRGLRGTSNGFIKNGTQFKGWPSFTRQTIFCGMSFAQDIRGFSCDIDWGEI